MQPIYITDLDHTFLRSNQSVSNYSEKVWNEKAKHAILSVATARSYQKSQDFLSRLKLDAPMILLDGTMVVSPEKKLIEVKTVNRELGDAVIFEGAKFDIYPFIITLNDVKTLGESFLFPTFLNKYQHGVLENYRNDPRMEECKDIRAKEMNLKLVYFGSKKILEPLCIHLQKTFGDALEYKLSPEKYSDGWFLTILHPDGDKAHALTKVMEYLERDIKDVTVFGDSINDIGMFKLAGKSVAVSNALDEVKKMADIVLPHSNDEDGVAKYLESVSSI
ncbi:MAG: HMP-PP hydrolase (pyridoxal phosphatase) Cof, detected in genetic screen for thiamin metabolic genes (PMID:15292217) [uncultured Sulfurovum sp.]|uniref:HMP-PP hydrolase (Pyridoxal phosphatase) Cof, detected in genetic screen for thiamin metabolic genes (PMID:15292217) n=1 Tax=uncultured Sulfurovum sp. TaxID=269237 RepID=A0A6S6TM12_9BACT|nr:MAG: HMP-PP hydrolase (pyridoxal phosphatase) Cof, detected in genetic screen for thiamin metabolic genes (PMID:15292217) [uncultured Sulfurovum sp.]